MNRILTFSALLWSWVGTWCVGQELDNGRIPFSATPFYEYSPLTINVGDYSDELASTDAAALLQLCDSLRESPSKANIQTLYILSVRLFDLGKRDEAFYWFHLAKTMARVFVGMLDPARVGSIGSEAFELKQFFIACNKLIGVYVNGYGFNDIEKGVLALERVLAATPQIGSMRGLYPRISFLPDTQLETVKATAAENLKELIAYSKANKEEILRQRIESGVQDKY